MLSFFDFLLFSLHTALLILSYIFPDYIFWFTLSSVLLVARLFFRRNGLFMHKLRTAAVIFATLVLFSFVLVTTNSILNYFSLWILYLTALTFEHLIPLYNFLSIRLRLFSHVKKLSKKEGYSAQISFSKILFTGARTPYNFIVITPKHSLTVGVLGSVRSFRYIIGNSIIKSQKFGNGKPYMFKDIAEIERFESDMEHIFPKITAAFLGPERLRDLPEMTDTDKTVLLLHPNSFIQEDFRILGMGERVNRYTLVSINTVFALL